MTSKIIDKLLIELRSWTQESVDKFHNNIERDKFDGQYLWKHEGSSVYLIRDTGAILLQQDGRIFKLTKTFNNLDWEMHNRLYDLTSKTNDCRIEIPIQSFIIIDNNEKLYFSEVLRPNKEFGRDYHLDILDGKVDNLYFIEYVNNVTVLLRYLKELSIISNGYVMENGITPVKRYFDNIGYFWTDFKKWNITYDDFIDRSIYSLDMMIWYLTHNRVADVDRERIVNYARLQWNFK